MFKGGAPEARLFLIPAAGVNSKDGPEDHIDERHLDDAVGEGGDPPARQADDRHIEIIGDQKGVKVKQDRREELAFGDAPEIRRKSGVDDGVAPADALFTADEKPADRKNPADKKGERAGKEELRLRSPSKKDRDEVERRVIDNRYPSPRADRTISATFTFGVPLASSARAPAAAAVASSATCAAAVTSARWTSAA